MELVVYVEGGGDRGASRNACRLGFTDLFVDLRKRADLVDIRLRFVSCGGRDQAYDKFWIAVTQLHSPDRINILLVDQENEMPTKQHGERHHRWRHVKERDSWERPKEASDSHLHFMTMSIEAWILADQPALAQFYGSKLNTNVLPKVDPDPCRERRRYVL